MVFDLSPCSTITFTDYKLMFKVSVIIHSAATVKLNEPLAVAWKINVEGTRMLLALSRRMKKIEVSYKIPV